MKDDEVELEPMLDSESAKIPIKQPRSSSELGKRQIWHFLLAAVVLCIVLASISYLLLVRRAKARFDVASSAQAFTDNVDGRFNYTKVATILEPRMSATLIPVLLNFLSIVPSDWPFVFWGSTDNIDVIRNSSTMSRHILSGRLNLTLIPDHVDIHNGEYLSRFLTKPWFWSQFHPEAEYMLFFQSDSILCSASEQSVDDWLGYDWVGSPTVWSDGPGFGGNGGLSIRKLSTMKNVTENRDPEFVRKDWHGEGIEDGVWFEDAEDYWFMKAINTALGKNARWPRDDGRNQNDFSALEDREILRPLGVHKGHGVMGLWGAEKLGEDWFTSMNRLLRYCPELALVLDEGEGRFTP